MKHITTRAELAFYTGQLGARPDWRGAAWRGITASLAGGALGRFEQWPDGFPAPQDAEQYLILRKDGQPRAFVSLANLLAWASALAYTDPEPERPEVDLHPSPEMESILSRVAAAEERGEMISDGCARAIAGQWADGNDTIGYGFLSTGTITDPDQVWNALFGTRTLTGGTEFEEADPPEQKIMNALGAYLKAAGERGPVPGWTTRP